VDERVRSAFAQDPFAERNARFSTIMVSDAGGSRESLRLDVLGSNRAQLLDLGVPAERIEISELCTGSRTDLFFSSRMEGGSTGRFAVVLGLR
jgi:copper oxidase (laccase) domain-containing protein